MTFLLILFSVTPVQAAESTDDNTSCISKQTRYHVGAPGKGTMRKRDKCQRVEFSAFELTPTRNQSVNAENGHQRVMVGKPGYNRRPKN